MTIYEPDPAPVDEPEDDPDVIIDLLEQAGARFAGAVRVR